MKRYSDYPSIHHIINSNLLFLLHNELPKSCFIDVWFHTYALKTRSLKK